MKFYIPIPDGMELKRVNGEDCLVDANNQSKVEIQHIIKDYLRNPKKDKLTQLHCVIYTTLPPNLNVTYAIYEPKNNGKDPADKIEIVDGKKLIESAKEPASPTLFHGHASSWMQGSPLSEARRKQLEEKRDEQRENRRHMGDNPKPT